MFLIGLMVAVAAIASLVAFLALIRNPNSKTHRWLFLLIISACFWVIVGNLHSIFEPTIGVWFSRFAFIAATFLGISVIGFCRAISGVSSTLRSRVWLTLVVLVNCVLSLTPLVIESLSFYGQNSVAWPVRGVAYPLVVGIILYLILHGVVLLDYNRRHQSGVRRVQLWIVEVGLMSGTLVGIITNVLLPNLTMTTLPSRFAFLAIIILTGSLIYAVAKHKFLDIRLTVSRTAAYVITLLAAGVLYAGVVLTASQLLVGDLPLDHPTRQLVYLGVTVIVAVTFHPLKLFFDRVTNQLFFYDRYDTNEVLDAISDTFVEELDTAALIKRASTILSRATKSRYTECVLIGRNVGSETRRVMVGRKSADTSRFIEQLSHLPRQEKLVVADELEDRGVLHESMTQANIAIVVRLETAKELLGYLLVGYKANGAAYTGQDIGLIRIAADELALAIQNALRFEEIENFNETLKKKVADATAQLRESNVKLKELDIVKDEFISMASHQLRTPLTSIKGYLSMVLDGDVGKVQPEQHKLLEEAFLSAQRMVFLIGDFLNVSRIQTGKFVLEMRPTNLADVVVDELERLRLTADHRKVKIDYHKPAGFPLLNLDEDKVRQVTMNFIDNAIFYSKPGGRVKVELQTTGHEVRFTVADTGIGVPASERDKLFTKFFRASNARRIRPDGTGIGLFLAKKVIAEHGGTVIGESQENVGSTFGFTLPLNTLPAVPGKS